MESLAEDDPSSIGGYELRARLGAGGFGVVYFGLSPGGRAVAVKVPRPELARDPEFLRRFRLEVAAARQVNGLFTAPVAAAGLDDRPPWVATAFVPGPPLNQVIAGLGPLPEATLWRLLAGLVEALQAIHACGLVHRDLKPENVLLAADGPRVIDFGISKAVDGSVLTSVGVVMGTPGFMSPEQVQGKVTGAASDVFALGCVLAYAATGRRPFGGGDVPLILYRVVHDEPMLDQVPPRLLSVVKRCLAKEPTSRPDLAELASIGRDGAGGAGALSPASFWPPSVGRIIRDYQDRLEIPGTGRMPATSEPVPVALAGPTNGTRGGNVPGGPLSQRAAPPPLRTVTAASRPKPVPGTAPPRVPHPPATTPPRSRTPGTHGRTLRQQARQLPTREPGKQGSRGKIVLGSIVAAAAVLAGTAVALLGNGAAADYTTLNGADGAPPNVMAFSPDGKVLAGGYADGNPTAIIGNTYLWNVTTRRQVGELQGIYGKTDVVQALAFSPDGKKLAVGYSNHAGDGVTCVWDIALGKCALKLGEAGSMAFSPDGKLLAIGSSANTTYVWNTVTRRMIGTVLGGSAVAFSGNGRVLATGNTDGTVYMWNPSTRKMEAEAILPANAAVTSIALSPDGAHATAAFQDGSTYFWPAKDSYTYSNTSSPTSWQEVDQAPSNVLDGAVAAIFSPNGKKLLTAESDGTISIRTVPSLSSITTLAIPASEINAVSLSPDGKTLAVSPNESPIYMWPANASHM